MQETYPIHIINNHIIANINGTNAFIESGCPTSFGRVGNIRLMGEDIRIQPTLRGNGIEVVHRLMGDTVDMLMGNDILGRYPFIIDLSQNTLIFSDEPLTLEEFQTKPITVSHSVGLLIEAVLDNDIEKFILDTGAMQSYLARKYTKNLEKVAEKEDYSPLWGDFTTPVYNKTVNFFDGDIQIGFGNLPIDVEKYFTRRNIVGIIGSDLFRHYIIELDYHRQQARFKRI